MGKAAIKRTRAKPSKKTSGRTGLQAEKSANTCTTIVEAAIQCILKYGYANTTTLRIAESAGLSRGAMNHHFSNRMNVMQSAVAHLLEKRIKAFKRASSDLPAVGNNRVRTALMAYWKQSNNPLNIVLNELTSAARTDKELARILIPARKKFHKEWIEVAMEQFPEWQPDPNKFSIALHLTQNLLDGMFSNMLAGDLDEETADKLLDYLVEELRELSPVKSIKKSS